MVEFISKYNSILNNIVWGIPMLILIIGTGIYMTIRTRFFQITKAKHVNDETICAIFKKKSVTKTKEKKAISQFQALTTALAATIGTGNIAGVATAITLGGPGAVFWMWISAFFGMMTNFSENVLGIYYRKKNVHGEWSGGAMYYISEGLKDKKGIRHIAKPLAVIFSLFCIGASFGIGNLAQINTISEAMATNFHIPRIATGVILAAIAGLVIIGGIKRIASVTEKMVPFMAIAYIICALLIFIMNYKQIPYVFSSIFRSAFNFTAVAGGAGGYIVKRAVTWGFKRGVFSNEAGLGSSVMVHSASDVKEPVTQGIWGIFEVFFDTIIVCTLTAFVLLSSSTHAVTLEEALSDVTTTAQVFEIYDGGDYDGTTLHLIDNNVSRVMEIGTAGNGEAVNVHFDGNDYVTYINTEVPEANTSDQKSTAEKKYIFSNVMSIRAEYVLDENGAQVLDADGNPTINVILEQIQGVSLVTYAMRQKIGNVAGIITSIAILLFAFSTSLGWSFYGTKAFEYLFGTKASIGYKVVFVLFTVVSATMSLQLAWDISDTLNGLMAIPNLIGVLCLSGTVVKITNNYIARRFHGEKIKPMLSAYDEIQKAQEQALKKDESAA